jgi:hypothetical protein
MDTRVFDTQKRERHGRGPENVNEDKAGRDEERRWRPEQP